MKRKIIIKIYLKGGEIKYHVQKEILLFNIFE